VRLLSRESHEVELVDEAGGVLGSATVDDAHRAPGRLHRAFSVFLRDPSTGRVLLQQRAAVKTRFPMLWANSCCGHPRPGQAVTDAAHRRLAEELGVAVPSLTPVGIYTYRAEDPATGRVEHEYDHVLVGDLPPGASMAPDPAEVATLRWVTIPDLLAALRDDASPYAPWLAGVAGLLDEAPERPGGH
jgi:isopentenyl-diphosphate delta-isomerase